MGYQKKGYTDGEIGVAWIVQFDKHTNAKAAGRRRLLIVDGHNSHYTRGFLEHARAHRIHVLCYPSHSTHIYQGLDVVIFSQLKQKWSQARDEYERSKGIAVVKSNFLEVYSLAHNAALTPENIKTAFRKTGVVPFDPNVVTEQMMAPSLESSSKGTLPSKQSSPVQAISKMIENSIRRRKKHEHPIQVDTPDTPSQRPGEGTSTNSTPTAGALNELASTSAAFLLHSSPLQSTSTLPQYVPHIISPFKKRRYGELLELEPITERERLLQDALRDMEAQTRIHKEAMAGMQAATILGGMYVDRAQKQLQALEKKKTEKSKKKLMGDGLPKLLDGDTFFQRVVDHEEQTEREKAEKEQRTTIRAAHSKEITQWQENETARVARNKVKRALHKEVLAAWEEERQRAKAEKRRPGWIKPKLGPIEKPIPRPKTQAGDDEEELDDDDEGEQQLDDDDNDDDRDC